MSRRLAATWTAVLAVALSFAPIWAQQGPPAPAQDTSPQVLDVQGGRIRVVTVASGLFHPWSLAFLPDGRSLLVAERDGRLRIIRDNAIDPLQNTQQITSSLNFSKRYRWGTLTLGGNRRQSLSDGSVQQLLPALTISPVPIGLGSDITWSPGLSITNNTSSKTPLPDLIQVLPGGALDTIAQTGSNRVTALSFDTPIRFGGFNWQNSIQASDERNTGRPRE